MVQTAVSVDGTERYLMRMADGETVETVWMPDGDGASDEDTPADDNTFLEEEEGDDDVADLIDGEIEDDEEA